MLIAIIFIIIIIIIIIVIIIIFELVIIFSKSILFKLIKKDIREVEGNPKVPFSIATTPRCKEVQDSIPWIAPLYHLSVPYNSDR